MPLFAALLESLFLAIGKFLAKLFLAKIAIRVVAVTAIGALGTALMLIFNGFVAPLVAALFQTQYGQLLGLVFPPVAGTVISGLITLWAAATAYRLHVRAIQITANI